MKKYIFTNKVLDYGLKITSGLSIIETDENDLKKYFDERSGKFADISEAVDHSGFFNFDKETPTSKLKKDDECSDLTFVDILPNKGIVSGIIAHYLEVFKGFTDDIKGKKIDIFAIKDFIARKSARSPVVKNSVKFSVDLENLEFSELDLSKIQVSKFNLKELIDEKE